MQHVAYGISCDVTWWAKTIQVLRMDNNTSALYMIRYNPATHACKLNGQLQKIDETKSWHALCTFVCSLVDKDERDIVHTIYMNFDSVDNTSTNIFIKHLQTVPAILHDEDYADGVKEWLFDNIIPSDYMDIDDALPECQDIEIDVMLLVMNEMDKARAFIVWAP